MRLFGLEITRTKATAVPPMLAPPSNWGWLNIVREPFTGAWQRNLELRQENILTYFAVYACVTLIASDVAKIGLRLVEQDADGVWTPTASPAFSPVLRKPNRYQTKIKFIEQWMVSKLLAGNTYVLLERDARQVVVAMYVLDPRRVKVLVAPDGSVFYELANDNLSGINDQSSLTVPASEIIHDVMVPLYHPLCGVSPLTACGLAAAQGLAIQNNSTQFFTNGAQPGGIITAPRPITDEQAAKLKHDWNSKYTGTNAGKTAVLGDGLEYKPITVSAVDSQLIEQLNWTGETVCSCFRVPPHMIGLGETPSYNNVEALNQQYYQQCLQSPIECIEALLDEGLGLTTVPMRTLGTEFDLEDLLKMDTATKVRTAVEALKGIMTPNEARKKFDLIKKPGGDAVYMQQQNYSIEALNKRDQKDDPFATATKPPAPRPDNAAADEEEDDVPEQDIEAAAQLAAWNLKTLLDEQSAA